MDDLREGKRGASTGKIRRAAPATLRKLKTLKSYWEKAKSGTAPIYLIMIPTGRSDYDVEVGPRVELKNQSPSAVIVDLTTLMAALRDS